MKAIVLGRTINSVLHDLPAAAPVSLDLLRLIESRLLIAGMSGSGKSYLVRLLAEGVIDHVPTIILDREGEFSTLREKHDVVLIGEGGEADTAVATAAKLARTLVELGVSAVVNLYELSKSDKRKFVRLFLDALMSLPRNLWKPMFVIVDEAHEYCPESGREAESRESVIRLMDSGRKRGICGVLCTQRFSKLSKDAASEAGNVLIGMTTLDVDLRRASDTLGFSGKSEWKTLRALKPGQWFGFGNAFNHHGLVHFVANESKTTHPKPGQRHKLQAPAPSRAILKVAPELAALKQAVVEEKNELQRLRDENAALKAAARKPSNGVSKTAPDLRAIEAARQAAFKEGLGATEKIRNDAVAGLAEIEKSATGLLDAVRAQAKSLRMKVAAPKLSSPTAPYSRAVALMSPSGDPSRPKPGRPLAAAPVPRPAPRGQTGDPSVSKGMRRLLIVLAQHPEGVERTQLALLAQFAPGAGHFSNLLSEARGKGWMTESDKRFFPTEEGITAVGDYEPLPEGQALVDYWVGWAKGAGKAVLLHAIDAGEDGISREDLAIASGLSPTAGHYSNILSEFRTAKLIEGSKHIKASKFLLV